jgi:hypothetical protein
MRRALVIYLLAAVLLGCAVAAVQHVPAQGSDLPQQGRNAAWLDHGWVSIPQPLGAIAQLCGTLRLHAIGTVYVHVGPVDGSGRIAAGRAPAAERFIHLFHARCPGVRALAWIGQLLPVWDGLLDLHSASVRDGLVATASHFAALGFDGVQYDLEPVADGDPAFLDLLRRTRHALGNRWLAVATPALLPAAGLPPLPHLRLPLTPWSRTYYARVAAVADELDPLLYVTALRDPADYTRFVAEQAADLVHLLPASHIRPGLPAFGGHTSTFDDRAENLQSALAGIDLAFPGGAWPDALTGVAIYPFWDMTPAQWAIFDRWLAAQPRG